jgi:hypothetical protein
MLDLGAQATTNIFDNVLDAPYEFAQIVSIQEIKAFHHSASVIISSYGAYSGRVSPRLVHSYELITAGAENELFAFATHNLVYTLI